jgi:peptide/nickel transport system permease protein
MLRFIVRKLAGFAAIVLVTCAIVFACLSTAPGAAMPAGGLPGWLGRMLIGDFGTSAQGGAIGGRIAASLAVTLPLALLALILATALGGGAGYLAWRRRDRWPDRLLTALGTLLATVPSFWLGMVLVLLFALMLRWLPAAGFLPWQDNPGGAFLSLILPSIALALPTAGSIAGGARDALVETADSAPIVAARTRGLSESDAMRRYGLLGAALRIVSGLGSQLATLVAGTVIVESVFYLPGLGRLIIDAVVARDAWLVGGGLVILVLLVSGTTFLIQLGFAWLNPKLRPPATA